MVSRSSKNGRSDVTFPNSTRSRVLRPTNLAPIVSHYPLNPLRDLDYGQHDGRYWNPTRATSGPASLTRGATRLNPDKFQSLRGKQLPWRLQFALPRSVALCVRRRIRRQIMFAMGLRGKGSGSKRNRNVYSGIKC